MKVYKVFYAADKVNEQENGPEYLLGIFNNFQYGLNEVTKKIHKNQTYFKFVQRELETKDFTELKKNIKLLTAEKNDFTDCGLELLEIIGKKSKPDLEQI